jgi:hypothetical protein
MDFCSSGTSCLCASTRRKGILLNLLILCFIRAKCSDQATKQRSSGDQVAIKEWSTSAQAVFKPCSISGVPPKFWFCPNKPIEDHECITFFLDNIGNESNTANVWCFEDYCFWTASKFQYKKLNCLREEWVRTMLLPNEWNNLLTICIACFCVFREGVCSAFVLIANVYLHISKIWGMNHTPQIFYLILRNIFCTQHLRFYAM